MHACGARRAGCPSGWSGTEQPGLHQPGEVGPCGQEEGASDERRGAQRSRVAVTHGIGEMAEHARTDHLSDVPAIGRHDARAEESPNVSLRGALHRRSTYYVAEGTT